MHYFIYVLGFLVSLIWISGASIALPENSKWAEDFDFEDVRFRRALAKSSFDEEGSTEWDGNKVWSSEDDDEMSGSGDGSYETMTKCERQRAAENSFGPQCTANGEFEPKQCKPYGDCWCVTEDGDEIDNTRTSKDINCDDTSAVEVPIIKEGNTGVGSGRPGNKDDSINIDDEEPEGGSNSKSDEDEAELYEDTQILSRSSLLMQPLILADTSTTNEPISIRSSTTSKTLYSADIISVEFTTKKPKQFTAPQWSQELPGFRGSTSKPGVFGKKDFDDKSATAEVLSMPGILAGIIAFAVVCLLCAVLLVMFIVYRMRKKDEGSYALDEPKHAPLHNYQRAPTKEYFA